MIAGETVPIALRDPTAEAVRDATRRLLERRHAQRAAPSFGDAWDDALLAALRGLPEPHARDAASDLLAWGESLGREVYARRCFEDNVQGAVAILSTTLLVSGWGGVALDAWFHRAGVLAWRPSDAAAAACDAARDPYFAGLVAGYLGEAFNCRAQAESKGADRFEVRLLEARDVNAGRAVA